MPERYSEEWKKEYDSFHTHYRFLYTEVLPEIEMEPTPDDDVEGRDEILRDWDRRYAEVREYLSRLQQWGAAQRFCNGGGTALPREDVWVIGRERFADLVENLSRSTRIATDSGRAFNDTVMQFNYGYNIVPRVSHPLDHVQSVARLARADSNPL